MDVCEDINVRELVIHQELKFPCFSPGISELTASDAIVGPVFARIIGVQFQRIKVGDRFWHETNDATVKFTDGE